MQDNALVSNVEHLILYYDYWRDNVNSNRGVSNMEITFAMLSSNSLNQHSSQIILMYQIFIVNVILTVHSHKSSDKTSLQALNFVNTLKADRAGKAVVSDVIDEGSSGLESKVSGTKRIVGS